MQYWNITLLLVQADHAPLELRASAFLGVCLYRGVSLEKYRNEIGIKFHIRVTIHLLVTEKKNRSNSQKRTPEMSLPANVIYNSGQKVLKFL